MYIVLVNGGAYEGGRVFRDTDELQALLDEWSAGEEMLNEDEELVTLDDLIDAGGYGEPIDVYCQNMVEMGDDFVQLSVIELQFPKE